MQCRWPLKPLDSTICIRPHHAYNGAIWPSARPASIASATQIEGWRSIADMGEVFLLDSGNNECASDQCTQAVGADRILGKHRHHGMARCQSIPDRCDFRCLGRCAGVQNGGVVPVAAPPILARSFLTLRCQFGRVRSCVWPPLAYMTAGPDEVRGLGLNQSDAVITACRSASCPYPRFDRLASRCLVTLAKLD